MKLDGSFQCLLMPFVVIDWPAFAAGAGVACAGLQPPCLASLAAGTACAQVSGDRFKGSKGFSTMRGAGGNKALNVLVKGTSSLLGTLATRHII